MADTNQPQDNPRQSQTGLLSLDLNWQPSSGHGAEGKVAMDPRRILSQSPLKDGTFQLRNKGFSLQAGKGQEATHFSSVLGIWSSRRPVVRCVRAKMQFLEHRFAQSAKTVFITSWNHGQSCLCHPFPPTPCPKASQKRTSPKTQSQHQLHEKHRAMSLTQDDNFLILQESGSYQPRCPY